MSRDLNKILLMGNLGNDPEIRTVGNGSRVAQLSLATTRRWRDAEGELHERTEWHRLVIWDGMAGTFNFVERYLRKGDRIFVEGQVEYRSYEDKDGVRRYSTEIRVHDLSAAGALKHPPSTEDVPGESAASAAGTRRSSAGGKGGSRKGAKATASAGSGRGEFDDFQSPPFDEDDDLPF